MAQRWLRWPGTRSLRCSSAAVSEKNTSHPRGAFRAFCENCGTPLTWEGDGGDLGQIIELHISTFDDPESMIPTSHAFAPERLSWFDVADDLPRYEGFSELSPLLHRGPASRVTPE